MMNVKVTLSAKATKKLSEATREQLKQVISSHIGDSARDMERLLWNMTYDPETVLKDLGFPAETATADMVRIRAEMAGFFKRARPAFNYGSRFTPVTAAQKLLNKALKNDRYAYDTVMSHIKMRSGFDQAEVAQMIDCLMSSKENRQFGGIRKLGFRVEEAVYLKGAAYQMGEVLKGMPVGPASATNQKPAEETAAPEAK